MTLEDVSIQSTPKNEAPQIEAKKTVVSPAGEKWSVEGALKSFGLPTLNDPPKSPIAFFHMIERLKTTPREGWRRFGIAHGESIGDHMYRMSMVTLVAPPSLAARLDVGRCTRMALVHDMAEALVGDITPVDGVSKAEKHRREAETIDYITGRLLGAAVGDDGSGSNNNNGSAGAALRAVWREYEDDKTEEAHFVHDVDKLELVLQMVEYEKAHAHRNLDLGEFCHVARRIKLPEMRRWCADVMKERAEFWAAQGINARGLDIGKEIIDEFAETEE